MCFTALFFHSSGGTLSLYTLLRYQLPHCASKYRFPRRPATLKKFNGENLSPVALLEEMRAAYPPTCGRLPNLKLYS